MEKLIYNLDDLREYMYVGEVEGDEDLKLALDWQIASQIDNLSGEFIEKYATYIHWFEMVRTDSINEEIIDKCADVIPDGVWDEICANLTLSKEFILKHHEKFIIDNLLEHQNVPAKVIYKNLRLHEDELLYQKIIQTQKLTPQKIKALIKTNNEEWMYFSKNAKLTNKTMLEYKHEIYWGLASQYQEISENTIKELKDYVHWSLISKYQKMSKDFIIEMSKLINLDMLRQNDLIDQKELSDFGIYEMLLLS